MFSSHQCLIFNFAFGKTHMQSPSLSLSLLINIILIIYLDRGRPAPGGWVRGGAGGIGGGPARGRARAKGPVEKLSAEDLDADLEKYRLEAMQIN